MKEATKKLVEALEKEEIKFDLTEGESEEETDRIDFALTGDLTSYDFRIVVADRSAAILTFLINVIKEEKYLVLLETLNYLNYEYQFAKFYAAKNDEEEGYYVTVQIDSVYGDNYDPEETFDLLSLFFGVVEEAYPQIIKAIA